MKKDSPIDNINLFYNNILLKFYENFNTVHAVIKPDTDFEVINPLSLVEFSNHQFSTANFILTDNYEKERRKS